MDHGQWKVQSRLLFHCQLSIINYPLPPMAKPPAAAEPSLDIVRKKLREAGLRSTAARLWVMQMLIDAHSPLTPRADGRRPRVQGL